MSTSIGSNVYINYINRDTLTNKRLPYTLYTDFVNTSTNLYNYMYSLSGIVNNDINYCMNTFYTISSNIYFNYINKNTLDNTLNDYYTKTIIDTKLLNYYTKTIVNTKLLDYYTKKIIDTKL